MVGENQIKRDACHKISERSPCGDCARRNLKFGTANPHCFLFSTTSLMAQCKGCPIQNVPVDFLVLVDSCVYASSNVFFRVSHRSAVGF